MNKTMKSYQKKLSSNPPNSKIKKPTDKENTSSKIIAKTPIIKSTKKPKDADNHGIEELEGLMTINKLSPNSKIKEEKLMIMNKSIPNTQFEYRDNNDLYKPFNIFSNVTNDAEAKKEEKSSINEDIKDVLFNETEFDKKIETNKSTIEYDTKKKELTIDTEKKLSTKKKTPKVVNKMNNKKEVNNKKDTNSIKDSKKELKSVANNKKNITNSNKKDLKEQKAKDELNTNNFKTEVKLEKDNKEKVKKILNIDEFNKLKYEEDDKELKLSDSPINTSKNIKDESLINSNIIYYNIDSFLQKSTSTIQDCNKNDKIGRASCRERV